MIIRATTSDYGSSNETVGGPADVHDLTRTSSAAATGSATENLLNCFNHKKRERAAGARRLLRLVRAIISDFKMVS